ncbi:LiaF transmembrane domain-containing protein [Paenibacillus senegalensis]|uniref:LiaF transmembrane domain-containing protein n=1 Tax=Paenibacillus senegalensis TaxID=1465766 RepID=UPI00028911E4|nr:hypothetical protein [Paenibacillus senegalensis]
MKLNGTSGFALLLIGCGALIVMNILGVSLGGLMGYLIPIAMIGLGYVGFQNGKKLLGGVIFLLGAMLLIGKLTWIIGLIVAVAMIAYGVSMISKMNSRPY